MRLRFAVAVHCPSISMATSVALTAALMVPGLTAPSLRAQGPPPALPPQAAVIQVEGELEVLYEDAASGARLLYFLHVGSQRLSLKFDARVEPYVLTGTRIRARGRLQNNTLDVSALSGGSVQALSEATSNTFGAQKTLVLLVNFQDNVSTSTSLGSADATTFQTTSDFYLENTYGQTWLTGDVYGWYTLPMSSAICDTDTMATLADQAATANGVDVPAFPRRVYAFPHINSCVWWGLGNVGGNPSRAWINGTYSLKVVSHELGHNFGAFHSHSQPCDPAGCSSVEYGDDHDDMGQTSNGHFTAFQKERLGWLNYGSSPSIQSVSSSGVYWIDAYETPGSAPKALKILKSSGTYYYIEARTRAGFDANDAPGVLVHTGSSASGSSSFQLDLDPASTTFDSVLDVGQTFTDPVIGLSITPASAGAAGASLNVSYAGPVCTAMAPTVSLSPSATLVTSPGVPVSYSMSVKNNDDATCSSTNFALGDVVPPGWLASFDTLFVTLAPGAAAGATLSLTPPGTASGVSGFTGLASRMGTTGPGGSVNGSVLVATALDVTLSISSVGGGYQLTATVRVGTAPVSGAAVTFTVVNPLGQVTTLVATSDASGVATAKASVKGKAPRGTYQVQVLATGSSLSGTTTGTFVH